MFRLIQHDGPFAEESFYSFWLKFDVSNFYSNFTDIYQQLLFGAKEATTLLLNQGLFSLLTCIFVIGIPWLNHRNVGKHWATLIENALWMKLAEQ